MVKPKVVGLSPKGLLEKLKPKREPKPENKAWSTTMHEDERRLHRVRIDLGNLSDEELKSVFVDEAVRRNLSDKWFRQSEKTMQGTKKKIEEEKRIKQMQTEAILKEQQKPIYKFRLLSQLASHKRDKRIKALSEWPLSDLKDVLKEVASITTMKGVPSYRFEQAKQDLIRVISVKSEL